MSARLGVRTGVRAAALGALLILAACNRETTAAGSSRDAIGQWTLRKYDGRALPATVIQTASTTVEVVSGTISFNGDGTYQIFTSFRQTQGSAMTPSSQTGAGSWVDRGGLITIVPNGAGERTSGTLAGNTFVLSGRSETNTTVLLEYGR